MVGESKSMRVTSKKLRDSARGAECQVRLPGICNFNSETTIPAHVGSGGGMASKVSDLFIAHCCSACHDEIDGRTSTMDANLVELYAFHGVQRTQQLWLDKELIKLP
jgi:hypothetical protein